jgi:NADH dehydrogenase (ubiquinone) Fe-S protein 2
MMPAMSRRTLSTSPIIAATNANDVAGKGKYGSTYVMDTHTVEDLQGMSAQDVLAEHGGRPEKQMRHFTGALVIGNVEAWD